MPVIADARVQIFGFLNPREGCSSCDHPRLGLRFLAGLEMCCGSAGSLQLEMKTFGQGWVQSLTSWHGTLLGHAPLTVAALGTADQFFHYCRALRHSMVGSISKPLALSPDALPNSTFQAEAELLSNSSLSCSLRLSLSSRSRTPSISDGRQACVVLRLRCPCVRILCHVRWSGISLVLKLSRAWLPSEIGSI